MTRRTITQAAVLGALALDRTFLDGNLPVGWVAFSADGRRLAAGGSESYGGPNSEVIVWDAGPLK